MHENSNLFFLSPYTRVSMQGEYLVIYQTLFNQTVRLCCSSTVAKNFLNCISEGRTEKEICTLFEMCGNHHAKDTLEIWLQIGVLE